MIFLDKSIEKNLDLGKGVALNSAVSVFKTNMISERKNFLSKKGLEKIQKELEKLRSERLFRIKGDAPKSFRFGDIDPEYLMFQEEVRRIEKKINHLYLLMLKNGDKKLVLKSWMCYIVNKLNEIIFN